MCNDRKIGSDYVLIFLVTGNNDGFGIRTQVGTDAIGTQPH